MNIADDVTRECLDVALSDRHTVNPWLAAKLPFAAMIVDLTPKGFALLGGRVDFGFNVRPKAPSPRQADR